MASGVFRRLGREVAVVSIATLLCATCKGGGGGGGGSSGPVTAPTPITTSPPTVNINGFWQGTESHDSTSGTMHFTLTHTEAGVTGDAALSDSVEGDHHGPLVGAVSGNVFSFNFSVGMGGAGCGNALSGTATVGDFTMEGTWSGHNCAGGAITNGSLSLTLQAAESTASKLTPILGTWTGTLPAAVGGGQWTWDTPQEDDALATTFKGTVTVASANALNLGSGSFTGTTFINSQNLRVYRLDQTYSNACPSMLTALVAVGGNDRSLMVGNVQGTTCNGSVPATGIQMHR